MKSIQLSLTFALIFFAGSSSSQNPGEWMWIHGTNTIGSPGNFGIQGVSSPLNEPPSVYEACEWKDLSGNFWLFGGSNNPLGAFADLWKYDPVTDEWIWMKGPGTSAYSGNYGTLGVPDPLNNPSCRSHGASTWVDQNGDLWMFGGLNGGGTFSDLWKYEIATNIWTWMSGPNTSNGTGNYGTQGVPSLLNEPPSRREASASWYENPGNLWFMGGYGAGLFNDMWRYTISTNEWTWMKGSSLTGQPSVYGTQGVEAPANTPGARMIHCRWKDMAGNFWLFGGGTYFTNAYENDMWRFNPLTNNWTWMRGSNFSNSPGSYGTMCVSSPANDPPARFENRAATTDAGGNFLMFGGGISGSLDQVWNDIWKYCVSTNEWSWIEGHNFLNPAPNWGTLNVSSPLNEPDGRGGALSWTDNSGHLYLFGGWGTYNDLWKYAPDPACNTCNTLPIALFTAPHHVCPGTCTFFNNTSINSTSWQWVFQGGTPSTSTDEDPASICYYTPGQYDVTLIATNINGSDTLTLTNYITVYPFSPTQNVIQTGDTLSSNPGFVSYQWFYNGDTIPGATNSWYVAPQSGDYSLICYDDNGCVVEVVILNVMAEVDEEETLVRGELSVFPNPAGNELSIRSPGQNETTGVISAVNILGEIVLSRPYRNSNTGYYTLDISSLRPGMYYIELNSGHTTNRARFIKQ